ncbi:MAG TPA: hypothetical protein VES88_09975 [Gemmatimonadaceae bacterium]|nr:hypothetical protein [Gemmatimonadaceae bacterium]
MGRKWPSELRSVAERDDDGPLSMLWNPEVARIYYRVGDAILCSIL